MKKIIKKIIAIIISSVLLIGSMPVANTVLSGEANTYTAEAASQGGVYKKLISLKQKFPDGKYWNHIVPASEAGVNCSNEAYADSVTDTPCKIHGDNVGAGEYDCSYFDGGLQCLGFARKVFYDVFGIRESTLHAQRINGYSGLSVGDFVGFSGFEHYAIVLSINGSNITVAECNLGDYGAQYNCIIRWGREYPLSKVGYYVHATNYDSIDRLCTEHKWDIGKVTKKAKHNKTELVNGEKIYTCTVCGETKTEVIQASHSFKTTKTTAATPEKNGSVKKKCDICGKTKTTTIYRPKPIKVKESAVVYTGKSLKPEVVVKDVKGKKILKQYYTVSYKNNKKLGTATAIVKFRGKYRGSKSVSFKIVPKGAKLIKCTGGSKRIKVTWKRVKGIDGYQIQYSKKKSFSNHKTVTVKGSKSLSKTIKKLSAGTTYYVRVRTYKSVNKKKYYSKWSNVMSAKTTVVSKRTKALKAYKSFLKRQESGYNSDGVTGWSYDALEFALYDINSDGIPELFTHGGGQMDYSKVFTYKSGKIKNVYLGTGFLLYPNGTIRTEFNGGYGYVTYSYYSLNRNLDLEYLYRYTEWHLGYPETFTQGEYSDSEGAEEVEYSVVQENIKRITNGTQIKMLTYHTNSGSNRDTYL